MKIGIIISILVILTLIPSVFATDITTCTDISVAGTYVLQNDITAGTVNQCIFINASNVIFDGNGHSINNTYDHWVSNTYLTNGKAIYVWKNNELITNITIKNNAEAHKIALKM